MSTKIAIEAAKAIVQQPYSKYLSRIYFEILEVIALTEQVNPVVAPVKLKLKSKGKGRKAKQAKLDLQPAGDALVQAIGAATVEAIDEGKSKAAEKMRAYRAKKKQAAVAT